LPAEAPRYMTWEDRYAPPPEQQPRRMRPNVFARMARFAFRHPLTVIGLWIALAIPALPAADIMIGNEVAFDSPEAFNAAMASPVRAELRAHFRAFPKFTGRTTHYPMMRRRLHPSTQRLAHG